MIVAGQWSEVECPHEAEEAREGARRLPDPITQGRCCCARTQSHIASPTEADLADIYDENNSLRPVSEWPEIWRSGLVASVETSITQDGTRVDKVRLSDRLKRIEMIGRHVGVRAFVERSELTGKDGGPIEAVMVFNPVGSDDDDPG